MVSRQVFVVSAVFGRKRVNVVVATLLALGTRSGLAWPGRGGDGGRGEACFDKYSQIRFCHCLSMPVAQWRVPSA